MLRHLENENFDELVREGLFLVDFYATWCGPCKMLAPVLENIANNGVEVIKVDVDKHEDLAHRYKIMSVPTMFIIKNGEVKKSMVGYLPKEVILKELDNYR